MPESVNNRCRPRSSEPGLASAEAHTLPATGQKAQEKQKFYGCRISSLSLVCPLSSFEFPKVVWKQAAALLGLSPPHCRCRNTTRPTKYQPSFSARPTSLASFRLALTFRSERLPPEAAGDHAQPDKQGSRGPECLPLRPTAPA